MDGITELTKGISCSEIVEHPGHFITEDGRVISRQIW